MQGPTVRLTVLEPAPAPVTTDPYAVSANEAKLRRQKALYRSAFKGV